MERWWRRQRARRCRRRFYLFLVLPGEGALAFLSNKWARVYWKISEKLRHGRGERVLFYAGLERANGVRGQRSSRLVYSRGCDFFPLGFFSSFYFFNRNGPCLDGRRKKTTVYPSEWLDGQKGYGSGCSLVGTRRVQPFFSVGNTHDGKGLCAVLFENKKISLFFVLPEIIQLKRQTLSWQSITSPFKRCAIRQEKKKIIAAINRRLIDCASLYRADDGRLMCAFGGRDPLRLANGRVFKNLSTLPPDRIKGSGASSKKRTLIHGKSADGRYIADMPRVFPCRVRIFINTGNIRKTAIGRETFFFF